jgi:hypothetical protein
MASMIHHPLIPFFLSEWLCNENNSLGTNQTKIEDKSVKLVKSKEILSVRVTPD